MTERWVPQTPRDEAVRSVLLALRAFGDAIDRMHAGMRGELDMNSTDVAALRMLIIREQSGAAVSPHEVAEHLRISTASTTKLLDRLEEAGHVVRKPHPTDRRSRVLELTELSRREFYRHFGSRLSGMREVAERYTDAELAAIARFIGEIADIYDPPSRVGMPARERPTG